MTDIDEIDGYEYGVGWKGEAESQRARAEVAEAKPREALKLAEVSSPASQKEDDDTLTRVHPMDQVTHSPTAASNRTE